MKFVGSKNRISKELAPIIQSYITEDTVGYLEPFCGGLNMIDKIKCRKRVGSDIHEELIELLKYTQNLNNKLPTSITKEEYIDVRDNKEHYCKWYIGLVGFCGSYNAKYFGGYAGQSNTKQGIRNYDMEAIRNIEKQRKNIQDIILLNKSFLNLSKDRIKNYVIYCDIPYKNTTSYSTEKFPYDKFYKWCIEMSENNTVLISEYDMPKDKFKCIWSKEHITSLDKNDNKKPRIEKLFVVK